MRKLLTVFLDLVFPPTASEKLLRESTTATGRSLLKPHHYKNISYLGHYSNPLLKSAITENKFHHHKQAAHLLGNLLAVGLEKQSLPRTLFIPIPLGTKRLRERGHNQVITILISSPIKLNINSQLLQRTLETTPQSQLPKTERQQNMKKAFQYKEIDFDFTSYQQVIIVDDVVTTGSTLVMARATLAPHLPSHIKLSCLALAH